MAIIAPEKGCVLWFTGLSGAGKSSLGARVAAELRNHAMRVEVLDGDEVRTHLSAGLGFSKADRDINVLRIGWVAKLLARNGVFVVTAAISPYREVRERVRMEVLSSGAGFIEIFMKCPLEVLAGRDVKGLYKRAIAGEIANFTGVSDPYEEPANPDVVVDSSRDSLDVGLGRVMAKLTLDGYIPVA